MNLFQYFQKNVVIQDCLIILGVYGAFVGHHQHMTQ